MCARISDVEIQYSQLKINHFKDTPSTKAAKGRIYSGVLLKDVKVPVKVRRTLSSVGTSSSNSFVHLCLTSFHLENHALPLFISICCIARTAKGGAFAFSLLATSFVFLATSVGFFSLIQLSLLFHRKGLELVVLVVKKSHASSTLSGLLAISTKASLCLHVSGQDICLKQDPSFLSCLCSNWARRGQKRKRILKIDSLVGIILTNCHNGSKDRRVNRHKQIKQVGNTSVIIWDLNGDVFSTLRKGYECLPMQPHVLSKSSRCSARPLSALEYVLCFLYKLVIDCLASMLGLQS